MNKRIIMLLCCGALFVSSCATISLDASNLQEHTAVNNVDTAPYTVVKSFKFNDKAGWAIGFIPANKPAGDHHNYFEDMLDKQIRDAGGDAIINLRIRAQRNVGDFFIALGTLGLYETRTVTITGDVIKYKTAD